MCTQQASLRLIALTCFFIMVVDSMVLYQTYEQWNDIKHKALPSVYDFCFKPQMTMRIVFTAYAINAAALCFVLTCSLTLLSEP